MHEPGLRCIGRPGECSGDAGSGDGRAVGRAERRVVDAADDVARTIGRQARASESILVDPDAVGGSMSSDDSVAGGVRNGRSGGIVLDDPTEEKVLARRTGSSAGAAWVKVGG